ncbi:hypothetical protein TNCV_4416961 [Trichonephila clavipes]|uniref:Uncharacterized protein n=1 Tax=Trichonephila clavipes TaxID=2585209 RepID=A0A8X6VE70_TRICX|nr:hypothetical protein TNCV_4416961 [Trichonephila clavipes]
MSPYAATQGLLATDLVILNHGQITRTTPELAPPSPNFHTTPTLGRLSSTDLTYIDHHHSTHTARLQQYQTLTHDTPATNQSPSPLSYCGHHQNVGERKRRGKIQAVSRICSTSVLFRV